MSLPSVRFSSALLYVCNIRPDILFASAGAVNQGNRGKSLRTMTLPDKLAVLKLMETFALRLGVALGGY